MECVEQSLIFRYLCKQFVSPPMIGSPGRSIILGLEPARRQARRHSQPRPNPHFMRRSSRAYCIILSDTKPLHAFSALSDHSAVRESRRYWVQMIAIFCMVIFEAVVGKTCWMNTVGF